MSCALCDDTGFKMEKGRATPCGCPDSIERRISRLLPEALWTAKLEYFPEETRCLVDRWLAQGIRTGLFITGLVGRGKTYLSAAILRTLVERGMPVRFCRLESLILDIRETYGANRSTRELLR